MNKPYIGITGFTEEWQVNKTIEKLKELNMDLESDYIPMMGFLASWKTLNGKTTAPNMRYPALKEIPNLLKETHRKVFTTIHYNTKEVDTLSDQVTKIFNQDNIYEKGCKGIQFNVVNLPGEQVKKIKKEYKEMKIIIQLSGRVMGDLSSKKIAERIYSKYGKNVSYILIDPSGGQGKDFDIGRSCDIYESLKKINPEYSIGFAGGLHGGNVHKVIKALSKRVGTEFSIDAEGKLRDEISDTYDDEFNIEKVGKYLKNASNTLRNIGLQHVLNLESALESLKIYNK